MVSPAAFWNLPWGQPAAATAYGATAETAVEGTAGGATTSLAATTGAQEAFDAAARSAHMCKCTSAKGGGQEYLPKKQPLRYLADPHLIGERAFPSSLLLSRLIAFS